MVLEEPVLWSRACQEVKLPKIVWERQSRYRKFYFLVVEGVVVESKIMAVLIELVLETSVKEV